MAQVTIEVLEKLPRGTLAALELAVRTAAEWRGSYTGDAAALAEFDAQMRAARQALAAVKRQQRAIRHLMRHVQDVRGAVANMH